MSRYVSNIAAFDPRYPQESLPVVPDLHPSVSEHFAMQSRLQTPTLGSYTPGMDRDVSTTPERLKEFIAFLGEMSKESDRGVALVAAAMLDELLRRILLAILQDNADALKLVNGPSSPLGMLSARIRACSALGLLSESEAQEARSLTAIRNDFAHNLWTKFADQKISHRCETLTMSVKESDPRGRFLTSAAALIVGLTNRAHYVALERRTDRAWPY
jgi:DNA-binding MltR family transcriptional regulator